MKNICLNLVISLVGLMALEFLASQEAFAGSRICNGAHAGGLIELRATGVEYPSSWAIVSVGGQPDQLVAEGAPIDACMVLEKVRSVSVILRRVASNESHELFFSGVSTTPQTDASNLRMGDGGFLRAVTAYKVQIETPRVTRIVYPRNSSNNTLPQVIYRTDNSSSLYNNYETLGLGHDAQPQSVDSQLKGVTIGSNDRDSLLGALGLVAGNRIVQVDGVAVTTPAEVAAQIKKAGNNAFYIGYTDGDAPGVFTTTAMVESSL